MQFGYVAFLDNNRRDLQLYQVDNFGQIVDETPLYGQEQVFRELLPNNRVIQVCQIDRVEMPDGSMAIKTMPVTKITIQSKHRDVEHFLHGSERTLLSDMFDDFYSVYVDSILEKMDRYDDGNDSQKHCNS
jgi:hypothetical protein